MRASELRDQARRSKQELLGQLFGATTTAAAGTVQLPPRGNVVGVGYGAKVVGRGLDGLAVRVYVRTKRPRRQLSRSELIPEEVAGTPTDVVAVGDITARARPVTCGVSIGHVDITAGTLGCLVGLDGDDHRYVLSNNHVLANSNEAQEGDAILEPGPADGGDVEDPVARLHEWVPIDFDGANEIDAAVARLIDPADVVPEIAEIGLPGTRCQHRGRHRGRLSPTLGGARHEEGS